MTRSRLFMGAITVVGGAMVLAACSGSGGPLNTDRRGPDEFAVYSRAPLTMPPDYSLRPPDPNQNRVADQPRDDARQAVIGTLDTGYDPSASLSGYGGIQSDAPAAAVSIADTVGTLAILNDAGALESEPDIRSVINRETAVLADEDQSFTDRLIFWGQPNEYGVVVDPVEESRRIKQNLALGQTLTVGETPTIERRRRAILEGIFD